MIIFDSTVLYCLFKLIFVALLPHTVLRKYDWCKDICLWIQMHQIHKFDTLEQATTRADYTVSGTEIELSVHENGDR